MFRHNLTMYDKQFKTAYYLAKFGWERQHMARF